MALPSPNYPCHQTWWLLLSCSYHKASNDPVYRYVHQRSHSRHSSWCKSNSSDDGLTTILKILRTISMSQKYPLDFIIHSMYESIDSCLLINEFLWVFCFVLFCLCFFVGVVGGGWGWGCSVCLFVFFTWSRFKDSLDWVRKISTLNVTDKSCRDDQASMLIRNVV